MRQSYAVITTHDRPQDFHDCVVAIRPQVDQVVVVSHQASYVRRDRNIVQYAEPQFNISRAWNLGLQQVKARAGDFPYDVAILNDDAVVPSDWFERVTAAMRESHAAAGAAARDFDHRMAGYAFILASEAKLFADEQFVWWYGDDDLERRARAAGGVAQAQGLIVEHRHPNENQRSEIAREDWLRYDRKWNGAS